ncbi:mechanosensitive ion channel family protein [Dasania sp. GY-MA-18]|uniref:Mechanosensitive ion channel family protein n=1 Tax=Dasania phycosphaerae TaxID=2950436 RepID=A0A9J6RI31_9GAMM|nr:MULTISPECIES: mechanosensitive ion channel family protein [Dasania]MCR8921687.1 mechanosensitive ion channel family protein [Dasania sp. GY-MA-18]MCZ0864115.1 mechanosensitive ion channel family protein [Dasania phycosphaerae]MCZ0867843.1 mechanosensitive ion channel family protein [Dasania phycosphaerae]
MNEFIASIAELPLSLRLIVFVAMAVATHLAVIAIRYGFGLLLNSQHARNYQKLMTIATLMSSAVVFTLYFLCFGFILREFGVSLSSYMASATVIGLAIGFGFQGLVQDVVTGLTFIFSNLVNVGDVVEISGQTGIVRAITMRFVELENAMGAIVFIPNRSINSIINYPRGYVRCIIDVILRGSEENKAAIEKTTLGLMQAFYEQLPGIWITSPSSEGRVKLSFDKEILRIKYRIWPNRGGPIENTFIKELCAELQKVDPEYQAWMISINYEVEKKKTSVFKSAARKK